MHSKKYRNCRTLFFAVVFLTLPVGMPSARSATLLFSDNFETGKLSAWSDCNPNNTITTEQVHNGTFAMKFTPGAGGCARFLTAEGSGAQTVYLKMWWYFPAGFDSDWHPGHHTFRFSHRSGNQYLVNQFDTVMGSNMAFELNPLWGNEKDYIGVTTLPTARWFQFELLFKLNTPGTSDGEIYLYIDGSQVFQVTKQDFTGNVTSLIDTFSVTSNYDAPYTCASCPHYWYLDDIEVWNGCPAIGASCSTDGSNTTPPTPPGPLSVR